MQHRDIVVSLKRITAVHAFIYVHCGCLISKAIQIERQNLSQDYRQCRLGWLYNICTCDFQIKLKTYSKRQNTQRKEEAVKWERTNTAEGHGKSQNKRRVRISRDKIDQKPDKDKTLMIFSETVSMNRCLTLISSLFISEWGWHVSLMKTSIHFITTAQKYFINFNFKPNMSSRSKWRSLTSLPLFYW